MWLQPNRARWSVGIRHGSYADGHSPTVPDVYHPVICPKDGSVPSCIILDKPINQNGLEDVEEDIVSRIAAWGNCAGFHDPRAQAFMDSLPVAPNAGPMVSAMTTRASAISRNLTFEADPILCKHLLQTKPFSQFQ
jgi:hypothetical protein